MNKDARIPMLLDLYGKSLSESQYNSVDLYYNQDLSLSEIADYMGKSRQGVYDVLKRGESMLNSRERSLGFLEKTTEIKNSFKLIRELALELKSTAESFSKDSKACENIERILDISTKFTV